MWHDADWCTAVERDGCPGEAKDPSLLVGVRGSNIDGVVGLTCQHPNPSPVVVAGPELAIRLVQARYAGLR